MTMRRVFSTALAGLFMAGGVAVAQTASAPQPAGNPKEMTFFVTSEPGAKGADFGGIEGADAHCQKLARAAGAGSHVWRAYLSASPEGKAKGVNARDRIGRGPWQNFNGVVIANNLMELHAAANIAKQTALTEKGAIVNGRGDQPNMHDVLTGSDPGGTFVENAALNTCNNWRSSGEGQAIVGHHDRIGLNDSPMMKSWNSSHRSRGCGMDALKITGGAGLLYCFAVK